MLHKERFVIDAAHPRANEAVQPFVGTRLKVVCNIVSDPAKPPKVDPPHRLNLILTHCTGVSKEVWDLMIQQMYDEFGGVLGTVVVWDWVNHNESYQLNKHELGWIFVWADGGRDIVEIARHLKANGMLEGSTILIGHSLGGTMSLLAATYEPSLLFDSVVALDPILYAEWFQHSPDLAPGSDKKKLAEVYKHVYAKLDAVPDTFANDQEYEQYMTRSGVYRNFDTRVLTPFKHATKRVNLDGTVSTGTPNRQVMVCYYSGHYVYERVDSLLATVDHEVLHVIGNKPHRFSPAAGQKRAGERIKNATTTVIPAGTHLFPYEMPDETFAEVKPFVARRYARVMEKTGAALERSQMSLEDRGRFVNDAYAKWVEQFPDMKFPSKL